MWGCKKVEVWKRMCSPGVGQIPAGTNQETIRPTLITELALDNETHIQLKCGIMIWPS